MTIAPGLSRRRFAATALALGAWPALAGRAASSTVRWTQDQERFAQGVGSGDPDHESIILWTRREPLPGEGRTSLRLELARDPGFLSVIAERKLRLGPEADWTCRVLVGGLEARTSYWYRFTDEAGRGSRIGRTRTAPHPADEVAARFAFASCQNITMAPLAAWQRMVWDDEHATPGQELDFVLHLGDFVYETVWQPEDRPQGYFDRKLRKAISYPDGERHDDFEVPASLEDYRTLYREYLRDPHLQTARARWPFVAMWDNGEFSDKGWQSLQRFGNRTVPAQTRKAAANQAWFEFQPARLRHPGPESGFRAPKVSDAPVRRFDSDGLGLEPNNLAAISSLVAYRSLRWGSAVEIIVTDQRSYRSDDFTSALEARELTSPALPQLVPFETLQLLDAGAAGNGGDPPARLASAGGTLANFRRRGLPRTILGRRQKDWFLERLRSSEATWKIWGNTVATFDMRADPQNLPDPGKAGWSGAGYAGFARTDYSTAYAERAEICDHVERNRIAGFVTLSGDRHSFWAGYTSKCLPPDGFRPVGLNFVTGSITTPGMAEAFEYTLARDHPLRPLFLIDDAASKVPLPSMNLLLKHGVRTCLDYEAHRNLTRAKTMSNPDNAPHVEFVDMAGHGYGLVTADGSGIDVEFVCVPRPVAIEPRHDGCPILYRIAHHAPRPQGHEPPTLTSRILEGDPGLSA